MFCTLCWRLASRALALWLVAMTMGVTATEPPLGFALRHGPHQLAFNANGALKTWAGQFDRVAVDPQTSAGELRYRGQKLKLQSPQVARADDGLALTYHWSENPDLQVVILHRVTRKRGAIIWTRDVEIRSTVKLDSDLTVSLGSWPAFLTSRAWLPLLDGTGAALGTNEAAVFRFAGAVPGAGALLALPMVSIPDPAKKRRLLLAADPYFSTRFASDAVEWTYPAQAGLENGNEKRTVLVALLDDSIEDSIACFFRTLLPEVAPGPKWLHEIAMVDFDYLSDEGNGWFHDIDALSKPLRSSDRHQVFLCLHGWYDFLGRYCYDMRSGKMDNQWTAFSSYEIARQAPAMGTIGGEQVETGFANCKPVKMSLPDMHRRLKYARSRGFRAGLYFADGVNAGDGLPDFEPARVLRWGGWQGPDSKGRSYFMNPLHPEVRAFFLGYTRALLNEFGPDMDALVWDETFHVPCGTLGTESWPGYADRAMMRLVREITDLVDQYNRAHHRQIAFLTSDCLGAAGNELKAPYALVSHGTYQDSWCQPRAWSYGLFANYRNVLWSCCWWPVTKWSWVEFGVRQYQAPVAISNGWGNDKGFSELTSSQQARVLELFKWRKKQSTRLKWFTALPPEPSMPSKSR